jgi:hypothetical protein
MTDETTPAMPDLEGLDPGEIAVKLGLEQILKIHEIERTMLSRAIQVINGLTNQSPEDIIAKLSDGLNEEYDEAASTATAAANVAKLYVPPRRIIQTGI